MRKWTQSSVQRKHIASACQNLTDAGFTVHTIIHADNVRGKYDGDSLYDHGATIIAYVDEPDLSGGVPR